MSPSVETIVLFREVAGRKAFKKHIFESSFKEANNKFVDKLTRKDKYIRMSKNIKEIGVYAFYYFRELKQIVIPYGVTHIQTDSFKGCDSMESIIIPNSVIYIGKSAFSNCHELKEVKMSKNIKCIGVSAFYCCNISSITLPKYLAFKPENYFGTTLRPIKINYDIKYDINGLDYLKSETEFIGCEFYTQYKFTF